MKVLWIGNVVLPDFCDVFSIKRTIIGGWLDGFYHNLKARPDIELGLCFPIVDEFRMTDGDLNGCRYYSFHADFNGNEVLGEMIERFKQILSQFCPDVIHIWGTEYSHSLAMYIACEEMNLQEHVLVFIQGMVSVYEKHYLTGLSFDMFNVRDGLEDAIKKEQEIFAKRGEIEVRLLQKANHIAGRTEWDKACIRQINPQACYYYISEILRRNFYKNSGTWNVDKCLRHTIFMSQAHYPIKGLHFALEALQIIQRFYPDVQLRIAGNDITDIGSDDKRTPYGEYIYKKICLLSLRESITFLGSLDEEAMIDEYRNANVFISTSLIENSSNSLCEAMLIGTPVVSSCVGGCQDLIRHKETGLLYDVNAPYMLAHYVCELFDDPERCRVFSSAGVVYMSKRLNRTETVRTTVKIYNELANMVN